MDMKNLKDFVTKPGLWLGTKRVGTQELVNKLQHVVLWLFTFKPCTGSKLKQCMVVFSFSRPRPLSLIDNCFISMKMSRSRLSTLKYILKVTQLISYDTIKYMLKVT